MRQEISIPLSSGKKIKVRYAKEDVSPETYYDHMHDHSLLEVCIFLSGKMLHFSGGHTYRLSRGELFLRAPVSFITRLPQKARFTSGMLFGCPRIFSTF